MSKRFISHLKTLKQHHTPISMLTAYDFITASCLAECDIDAILVGDSLGNIFSGYSTTTPVTVDEMIYHAKAVRKGAPNSLIIVDMPFMSYRISPRDSKINATKIMQETGANAIKCEVNSDQDIDTINMLIQAGIPVMSHIGLTPQFVEQFGGFKKQGQSKSDQDSLIEQAKSLEAIGSFAIVLEVIPDYLAKTITDSLSIPTIGIGSGTHCDGFVFVINDVLGLNCAKPPSFSKQYDSFYDRMKQAVNTFKGDVQKKSIIPETD